MEATKSSATSLVLRVTIVSALALLMLATADAVWLRVSFWHEHGLALRLVAELEAGSASDGRTELRQIASLGEPAIEALIVAAASDRVEIALVAREIIEEKLAAWKVRVESQPDFDLARPVGLLARALADHVESFGSLGQQWSHRLSLELVESAAAFPAEQAVPILADCSTIMAAVPAVGPRMRTDASATQLSDDEPKLAMPDVYLPPWQGEEEKATVPYSENEFFAAPRPDVGGSARAIRDLSPFSDLTPLPAESGWVPEWIQRTPVQELPAPMDNGQEYHDSAAETEKVVDVPSPDEMAAELEKLRQRDTRSLLAQLGTAETYTAAVIRTALHERGISPEELPLATRLLGTDKLDRLKLVDDLKVLPARTARRWLRELLKDSEADVRLAALTALATTNDPELTAIARELVVRDGDPRVTELASRIVHEAR